MNAFFVKAVLKMAVTVELHKNANQHFSVKT